jgi:hypothetical protein
MTRVDFLGKMVVVGLAVALPGAGCSKSKPPDLPLASKQLRAIGKAYVDACNDLHPPRNKEDLIPYLKLTRPNPDNPDEPETIDPAEILRSPNDNEEFVILWGVDVTTFDVSGKLATLPVIAYEKHGKDGKRFVLQVRYPKLVKDEDMAGLPFPPGHKFQ